MCAKRIRRGTLSYGGAISHVAGMQWNDNYEMNRDKGDEEFSGQPVLFSRGGSGSFELLGGSIASGYATSDVVYTYNEVTVTNGVESVVQKAVTFTGVTFNNSGNVPAEGRGGITINFEYSTRSDPG